MAIVVFDLALFRKSYSKFSSMSDDELNEAFNVACLILDNTDSSMVPFDPEKGILDRQTLFNLLVCHLGELAMREIGQAGPLANAAQGSVNASFQLPSKLDGDYFRQTNYGQSAWIILKRYARGGLIVSTKENHPWG